MDTTSPTQATQHPFDASRLATLAESSNLLLGLDRKLTKTQEEPMQLPETNPIPGTLHGFGETTRAKRNVVFSDGGMQASQNRFYSEYHHVPAPVCDMRPTEEVFGGSSRLVGRGPMLRRT